MTILRIILDVAASFFVLIVFTILMKLAKTGDFLSEHAGEPQSGIDPFRVALIVGAVILLGAIWV